MTDNVKPADVFKHSLEVSRTPIGHGVAATGGSRQSRVVMIIYYFGMQCGMPEQLSRPRRCLDRLRIIASEEAGLKLSYPIPALGAAESRIARKPMLNP